jgi:hypothetical protein
LFMKLRSERLGDAGSAQAFRPIDHQELHPSNLISPSRAAGRYSSLSRAAGRRPESEVTLRREVRIGFG